MQKQKTIFIQSHVFTEADKHCRHTHEYTTSPRGTNTYHTDKRQSYYMHYILIQSDNLLHLHGAPVLISGSFMLICYQYKTPKCMGMREKRKRQSFSLSQNFPSQLQSVTKSLTKESEISTTGALASCDASLKCVAGIGEELLLL